MDLNKRLDQVDDEIKLLKNEIKQVLLEIQEQVLNAQNPFTALSKGIEPNKSNGEAAVTVKSEARSESAPLANASPTPPQESSFNQAPPAPPPQAAIGTAHGVQQPPPVVQQPAPVVQQPPPQSRVVEPSETLSERQSEPVEKKDHPRDRVGPRTQSPSDPLDVEKPKIGPPKEKGPIKGPDPDNADGPRPKQGRSVQQADAGPDGEAAKPVSAEGGNGGRPTIDLFTIAGLAKWTEQVVGKVGRENLAQLLEVSEMRGYLPKDVKEIVLAVGRLLGDSDGGPGLSPREMVSLLAQFDALTGSGHPSDSKMLSFLIRGDLEDFPSIPL